LRGISKKGVERGTKSDAESEPQRQLVKCCSERDADRNSHRQTNANMGLAALPGLRRARRHLREPSTRMR
jgi:hypothetical protein